MKSLSIQLLTLTRIPLTILFCFRLGQDHSAFFDCFLIFLLIVGTALLDGKLARQYGLVSDLGASLDVGTDLFFVASSSILLAFKGWLPIWFPGFILLKFLEFLLTSLLHSRKKNQEHPFRFDGLGKSVALACYLLPILVIYLVYLCFSPFYKNLVWSLSAVLAGLAILSSFFRILSLLKKKTNLLKCYGMLG